MCIRDRPRAAPPAPESAPHSAPHPAPHSAPHPAPAPDQGAGDRPARHRQHEPLVRPQDPELEFRLVALNATSIVGNDTANNRLPAILKSTPDSSTIVGISSSAPAAPISAASTPIRTPAIASSSTASTRYWVADRIRVAQAAPTHAPTRIPGEQVRRHEPSA